MAKRLTKKQEVFVDAFVETGVGSEAVRQAYDVPPENTKLASVMAAENLAKPSIQEAIVIKSRDRAALVAEAHESLLTAVRLDYFVFPKSMTDEEIKNHVEAQGLTLLNVRPSDKGKLAFFTLPDGNARAKGIEIQHKVDGTFAPEKKLTVHVNAEPSDKIKELAKKLNK